MNMETRDRSTAFAEVERSVERLRDPEFAAALDASIETELGSIRAKRLRVSGLRVAAVYNIFLLSDYILTPDAWRLSLVLHLAVVTPFIVFVALMTSRISGAKAREGLAALIPVAICTQVLVVFCVSRSPMAAHYLYFVPVAMSSLSSVQRLRAGAGFASAALIFVALVAALFYKHEPFEIVSMLVMTYLACVGASLNANRIIASEQRRHFAMALRDKLRAAESDEDANHDPLTGLGNRRYLEKRAGELWSVGAAEDRSVAAIVFDIDHFKLFNDTYGHARGDACLKRVAGCTHAELRELSDLAFRTGGEEFLILLPHVELDAAIGVAERIRRTIEGMAMPHESAAGGIVTASFGAACAQVGACSLEELIEAADGALYAAKRGGRNMTRSWRGRPKAGEKAA
ncbi:MAG: GGDEF domain-containing protein [Hyphomicrobiales bacterium]|nr:GGDEF domain-containing protein [Hyphomicrobiales bacterium]